MCGGENLGNKRLFEFSLCRQLCQIVLAKTTEVPPEAILDTFAQKGIQKHISPPILEEWDDF